MLQNKNLLDAYKFEENCSDLTQKSNQSLENETKFNQKYFQLTNNFVNAEIENFSDQRLENFDKIEKIFSEVFFKVKLRNKTKMDAKLSTNLFYEASKHRELYKYLDISHLNLSQLIHPAWGYLTALNVSLLSFL